MALVFFLVSGLDILKVLESPKVGEKLYASVVAKVARDRLMVEADRTFPGYGFSRHKGYGTRDHLAALRSLGPSPLHRYSFEPVMQGTLDL